MAEPIVYVDTSDIVEGKRAEVETAMKELADFVEANEPQLISYGFFLNEEGTQMTVVAVHQGSASLELHMDIAAPGFRKFTGLIKLSAIEVYGEVGNAVLGRLHQKAEMLGSGTVVVHKLFAGFTRFVVP